MGKAAMMGEAKHRPFEVGEHVEVGGLSGQGDGRGRQSGFAVQPGAPETSAGQEMCDRFQGIEFTVNQRERLLTPEIDTRLQRKDLGTSRVSASRTMLMLAGS